MFEYEKCKYFSYSMDFHNNEYIKCNNFCSKNDNKKEVFTKHCAKCVYGRVLDHYNESLNDFKENEIVGIFLQGSQNYRLDTSNSDVDTKLIVVPSFKDICLNKKPVSTTHVCANEEHIDFKDVRLYMDTFRKQNLNFLEILFTPYYYVNPLYKDQWNRLVEHREEIARMNPYRAVKSMKGIAMEKWHALEHPYPSKLDILDKWGYDPKQLHHLFRIEEYIERYINGESYADCLISKMPEYLIKVKQGSYTLGDARWMGKCSLDRTIAMADEFCKDLKDEENVEMRELLEDVSYNIMKIAVQKELNICGK